MLLNQEELNATHVMVDLETLSTAPDALIVSIGAYKFSFKEDSAQKSTFYLPIDVTKVYPNRYTVDVRTVQWWMRQSKEAQVVFNDANSVTLPSALTQLADWINSFGSEVRIWGNGANFDNVILRNAYTQEGIKAPWKYAHDRCFRSLTALLPSVPLERKGTHHNALDDAIYQAEYLIEAVKASSDKIFSPAKSSSTS